MEKATIISEEELTNEENKKLTKNLLTLAIYFSLASFALFLSSPKADKLWEILK
ncbi:MAG TPA: hypothetical protein PLJ97_00665 [Candidatus Saccharibacteria bacterium]|jgi:hypothetical protein|nr:hypothetical protein [Candidatus Saccharibacteria bacterium]